MLPPFAAGPHPRRFQCLPEPSPDSRRRPVRYSRSPLRPPLSRSVAERIVLKSEHRGEFPGSHGYIRVNIRHREIRPGQLVSWPGLIPAPRRLTLNGSRGPGERDVRPGLAFHHTGPEVVEAALIGLAGHAAQDARHLFVQIL